ncbi:hypothetical protein OOU_Y34scaffold01184g7 [Pyricularia oryzae Y34]|uniref:Uncharacterized protein n=1 Tax=Pyricularia oryzae (strain Y34) TaxID=1143189 RepID=A0AA97NLI2_PYRO3|nr:hypothetical protein OOU_Y34scaffold01184g7 [Pyricularia oryzae Y34]
MEKFVCSTEEAESTTKKKWGSSNATQILE